VTSSSTLSTRATPPSRPRNTWRMPCALPRRRRATWRGGRLRMRSGRAFSASSASAPARPWCGLRRRRRTCSSSTGCSIRPCAASSAQASRPFARSSSPHATASRSSWAARPSAAWASWRSCGSWSARSTTTRCCPCGAPGTRFSTRRARDSSRSCAARPAARCGCSPRARPPRAAPSSRWRTTPWRPWSAPSGRRPRPSGTGRPWGTRACAPSTGRSWRRPSTPRRRRCGRRTRGWRTSTCRGRASPGWSGWTETAQRGLATARGSPWSC